MQKRGRLACALMRAMLPHERRLSSSLDSSSLSDAERRALRSGSSSRAATGDTARLERARSKQQPVEDVEALLAAALLEFAYGEGCEEIENDACIWGGEQGRVEGGVGMAAATSKQMRVWRRIVLLCESESASCCARGAWHLASSSCGTLCGERPLNFSSCGVCAGARRGALLLPLPTFCT